MKIKTDRIIDGKVYRTCKICSDLDLLENFPRCGPKAKNGRLATCKSCLYSERKRRRMNDLDYANKLRQQERERRSQIHLSNPQKHKEYKENLRRYYRENKHIHLRSQLKRKYNITLEEYEFMKTAQSNSCLCCGQSFSDLPNRLIHIDHCHKTGKIRGILCHGCNTGLGAFKDCPTLLRKAATYLENANQSESSCDHYFASRIS